MKPKTPAIVGTIIAIAIAVIFWLVTKDSVSALLIGLVSVIISLLIEVLYELNENHDDVIRKLELEEALVDNKQLRGELIAITTRCVEVVKKIRSDSLFMEWFWNVINEFKARLGDLARGDMIFSANSVINVNIQILRQTKSSIKAVSYVDTVEYWNSLAGQRFLQENIRAMTDRKVKITRIFILERQSMPETAPIMAAQSQAGINVLVLFRDEVPVSKSSLFEDYLISDDRILHKVNFVRGSFSEILVSIDSNFVARLLTNFDALLDLAHDPPQGLPGGAA